MNLLGPLEVWRDGDPVAVPSGNQSVALAVLAVAAGRPVDVPTLARYVWGDEPPRRVPGAVQSIVLRLRHLLGASAIVTVRQGYALDTDPDAVDVHRFRRLVTADRLDDALALFDRLEKQQKPPRYRLLGHMGRAIVLALQSRAKESNDLFRAIAHPRPQAKVVRPDNLQWMWQEKAWSYWVRKALQCNHQNGVPLEDIPQSMRRLL